MGVVIGKNAADWRTYNQVRRIYLHLDRHLILWADWYRQRDAMTQINAQVDMLAIKAALIQKGYNPYRLLCTA